MISPAKQRRGVSPWLTMAAAIYLSSAVASAQAPPRDPQIETAVMLVRNVLTAVNHGNITGNYTVLRDLGGPAFRERNSAAQLSTIFQRIREQKTDLSPVLVLEPVFTEAPGINQAGQLQFVGFFPAQPLPIRFNVAFQRTQNGWGIDTVSVGTGPAPQPPLQNVGTSIAQPPVGGWPNTVAVPQQTVAR